ncbi:DUF2703 domain-containing protein [Syntrophus aciditrophicus]|uniref:Hypothetical cytosolic protein n=1 Tax=Syntrophus aciditrophicus (strain SB) TaxID=56780 RepID=Q2LXJ7_SYNAS|nr:DUF2703 domain-containing protein [Syntrophus aciditrophicus]ABC78810.1 hypothetical cytosolic protein [Syntrophus aciditrophicus SB]OPY13848.1 MAG: hypothetical protein A4E74_02486 [Syntrophus sp. PtaB.Bin075]
MKTLTVRWKRLVNEQGRTCERCGLTGETIQSAVNKLKKALVELGIEVTVKTEALDFPMFSREPLESNRIWIGEKPLEEWIGATVGQSPCCGACADSECRTLSIGNNTYEEIPENLVIQAGLRAAAELFSG